ncbi:MAG: GAF domain-containing protein [Anaerolineae bacterium]|nr:GAF domain-containing protein [Gloeobacterales cyanobacterium ES-bin-313]
MDKLNILASMRLKDRYEKLLRISLGWLPHVLMGPIVRQIFYRFLFRSMGRNVFIDADVDFRNAAAIEVGDNVLLRAGVRLDARNQGNRIVLNEGVGLECGVMIMAMQQTEIEVGEGSWIGPYSVLAGPGHLKIGKNCLIAAHAGIYANNHQFADPNLTIKEQGVTRKGIVIEDDCWLGHAVSVLDGVTIGRGSVIGAGSVVTKDIPPYSVAVGTPARVIRKRGAVDPFAQLHPPEVLPEALRKALSLSAQAFGHLYELRSEVSIVQLRMIYFTMLHRLFEEICAALDVDTVTLLLPKSNSQDLIVVNTIGLEEEIEQQVRIPFGAGVAGKIAANIQTCIVGNLAEVEVSSPVLRSKGIQSLLGVPLNLEAQGVGVFHVGSFQGRRFTSEDASMIESIAEQIAPLLRFFNGSLLK